jgi:hypothetical protein
MDQSDMKSALSRDKPVVEGKLSKKRKDDKDEVSAPSNFSPVDNEKA